jgi:hypothetical protein
MRLAVVICFAALVGCGGGGSAEPEAPAILESPESIASRTSTIRPVAAEAPKFTALVFIGNSLTRHPPNPAIGWTGDWGMAVSAKEKDYAHLTAGALGMTLETFNISGLEWDQTTYLPFIPEVTSTITSMKAVVVELGDNVTPGTEAAFIAAYGKLLDAAKPASALVCLSSWQARPVLDAKIKAACEVHGGAYVYIGDVYPTRKDVIGSYSNAGVDGHPHDWSMAVIADRATKALR